MGRFWSLLFLSVPILGVLLIVFPMTDTWPFQNQWLPEDVSADGAIIDTLFTFILILTGLIFIATGLVLFYFLWKYDAANNANPVSFIHGSHTLEVIWSILPAAVLLFIAIYQLDAWAEAKMRRPISSGADGIVGTADDQLLPPLAELTARQFEWRIRYAGDDGIIGTSDDLFTVNDLHIPIDEPIVLQMKSQDVLHSFFLPNLRVKQDVVPGMVQYIWFEAVKLGKYDIVCAELCGWGHYKMKGRLTVESREDYEQYLVELKENQNVTQFAGEGEGEDE